MVSGKVLYWLRAEGAMVLLLSVVLYSLSGSRWWVFAVFFLVPDVSFLAYLGGRKLATFAYNVAHSYVGPLALAAWVFTHGMKYGRLSTVALIWAAHIGWDRMIGYGLKYDTSFDDTHLGLIGKSKAAAKQR